MGFVKAIKHESKLRLAFAGPPGSGKTYSALGVAVTLAGEGGVALIDTERGSASKYADIFNFDVLNLDAPYHPDKYIQAIHEAEQAGYAVLVVDSLSHAWNGPGGLLEIVEGITKRSQSKNSYVSWGEATPIQNRLIDAITRAKLHIIVTMRSKQDYAQEKDERGKTVIRKLGMAPIQRDDLPYEFDIFADMDADNTMVVHKSRCPDLAGQIIPKPGAQVADILKTWLSGAPAPEPAVVAPQPPVTRPTPVPLLPVKTKDQLREEATALGWTTDRQWNELVLQSTERSADDLRQHGLKDTDLRKIEKRLLLMRKSAEKEAAENQAKLAAQAAESPEPSVAEAS